VKNTVSEPTALDSLLAAKNPLLLTKARATAAVEWAESYAHCRQSPNCLLTPQAAQAADLLLARIWLAQGRTAAALELLQEALIPIEAAGRMRLALEAYILEALAYNQRQEAAQSQAALLRALALARPEGLTRIFVDNGCPLAALLAEARRLSPGHAAHLPETPRNGDTIQAAADAAQTEHLTDREQDILALIAQGQTNRQIADILYLSVGTVKGHINHIFSKLEVQNRTQALLRAHELGLLDL
jgi:LuxR family transcriptional regulator, maltose regulon positive regulatory protein